MVAWSVPLLHCRVFPGRTNELFIRGARVPRFPWIEKLLCVPLFVYVPRKESTIVELAPDESTMPTNT